MSSFIVEFFSIALFFIGFYGLIAEKDIIKSIIAIGIMETAVVVFFLSIGYSSNNIPPIGDNTLKFADPLPQALVITAIIIGVAVTSVTLTMYITLCKQYKKKESDMLNKE